MVEMQSACFCNSGSTLNPSAMRVFVRVAQRSSFAAAARDLRLSPGAVTKHIAALKLELEKVPCIILDADESALMKTDVARDLFADRYDAEDASDAFRKLIDNYADDAPIILSAVARK